MPFSFSANDKGVKGGAELFSRSYSPKLNMGFDFYMHGSNYRNDIYLYRNWVGLSFYSGCWGEDCPDTDITFLDANGAMIFDYDFPTEWSDYSKTHSKRVVMSMYSKTPDMDPAQNKITIEFILRRDSTYQYIELRAWDFPGYNPLANGIAVDNYVVWYASTREFESRYRPRFKAGESFILYSDLYGMQWETLCDRCSFNTVTACKPGAACTPGSYKENVWSDECAPCPAGTFSQQLGATSNSACTPCASGKYSAANSSVCTAMCPNGTYIERNGSSSCMPCSTCVFRGLFISNCSSTADTVCRKGVFS
jgi:hypothetical protein